MTEVNEDRAHGATPATAVVDERLVAELVQRAGARGVSLTGEGGLLAQLTKLVLESSLEGEMDAHLGYGKHDPVGRDGGNSRNGKRSKTVLTEVGPVDIQVPRDRDASFTPQIVKILRERDASSVSLRMYVVTVTGFSLWTAYGVLTHSWPVAASNA